MPIQTIRDPKTGEERRVYVSTGGMGAGAPPKPKPQPSAGGGFMGTLNDFNPMKQITALGTGVSTFMQTGDLNKSIAAASREAAPTTALGQSVSRTLAAGGQRAVDAARLEIDRARLAREQMAAGTSPMDVKIPSRGPGAPSATRVRLPEWANYDDMRVEPKNPVEDVAASIVGFVPYFAVARGAGAPAQALVRGLPGVSRVATGFEAATAGLKAAGGAKRVAGIFAEEAVSGAIPSAIATYYATKPTDKTLSDSLAETVKGSVFEGVVARGLLADPNDTVEQARIKQSINDLIWSVPLGGGLGTGFRGIGAMAGATKRALADVIQGTIKVGQADQAVKDATTAPVAAAVDPSVPSAGTPAPAAAPAPRVVSGKPAFSSVAYYQGLRRQPLWEKTGVEIQGRLEPQAPQSLPVDSYTAKLNYSDVRPDAGPLNASGKRYAQALAGQDQIAIEATSQKLRASFNNAVAKLGIELGPNASSQSWSMWDIGKQLYMDANPAKSNKPYVLGNPLTNIQVQADIVDRMLGFEITKGVDVEGKRLKSWQLTSIGRKAREDAGVELGLMPDPGSQRTIPAPSAPPTPEAAAAALQQAQAELVVATQRLQSEAAKEVVTAPEVAAVPQGQLPGMNQPAYEQVATIPTGDAAVAPKVFQYKAEGQTATGRSGSLAEENVYDPRYAGVISVWRDKLGELGPVNQIYVANGHNRHELAVRSGFPMINVQFIEAATAAEARVVAALQNIKDDRGTAVDAGKLLRDTGMSIEDLRLQNVNLNGKLASEGVALSRLPQWLFDKAATGSLPTPKAVALGSAEGVDDAIISDVAKQAIAGKWSAEKIVQAMQEAKFASTSTGGGDAGPVLPGFEEMLKTSNVVALIDIRTAAFNKLSGEMRALTAASQAKNTSYLEAAGNTINVEGSQAARKMAAEAVAVFNRVTAYEGPVRNILNELAAQLPEGAGRSKAAANLVQFNLQRLRDAISEEMNGPRLLQDEAVAKQIQEPPAPTAAAEPAATTFADPLEAENLADARGFLGLPATATVAQVARVAKQEGYDGIVFTGDFGLPGGKREIDLRSLPEVKAPENAGNPVPIQAKPVDVAPVVDNETISTALERQALAEEAGDTELAGELGTWLGRRGVNVQGEAITPEVLPAPGAVVRPPASAIIPSTAAQSLWEDQAGLRAMREAARNEDDADLIIALGEAGAKEFKRLDRARNSSNRKRADAASAEFDARFGNLTPEQERLVYGESGDSRPTVDELDEMIKAHSDVETLDPGYLAVIAARRLNPEALVRIQRGNPSSADLAALIRMQGASRRFAETGINASQIPAEMARSLVATGHATESQAMELVQNFAEAMRAVQQTAAAAPRSATPLADAIEGQMREMAQSDARLYRRTGQAMANIRQGLDELAPAPVRPAPVRLALSASQPELLLPQDLRQTSPRYGRNTITFQSDLDRTAYVLANDAIKPSKSAAKFRQVVKEAGLNLDEVVAHGQTVRAALKQAAKGNPGQIELPAQPFLAREGGDPPPTKVSQQRLQRQIDDLDEQIIDNRRKAEQEGC